MGGCRCSYRNCSVKTDGKTHMFHYPVFDKVRCHQWLVNAHRLEFLNLKVSQLKNRVVCQHHFKDECFMNFKKEKLTFEAIPSENGPYCDPSKWVDNSHENSKLYPIVLEDIENDYCPMDDKKANFSLKYLDFLTNSESAESSYPKSEVSTLTTSQCEDLTELNFMLENNIDVKMNNININQTLDEPDLLNDKLTAIKNNINKSQVHPILIVPPFIQLNDSGNIMRGNECLENNLNSDVTNKFLNNIVTPQSKPKVRIISEKKITEPVSLSGNFKPISPSIVLNVSHLNRNNSKVTDINIENGPPEQKNVPMDLNVNAINLNEMDVIIQQSQPMLQNQQPGPYQHTHNDTVHINTSSEKNHDTSKNSENTKVSLLKKQIPPKRIAAIEEKRKFNMKLKEILESCVIKAEESDLVEEKKVQLQNCQEKVQNSPKINTLQNNDRYLSQLEARMTRMENLLLNKIDQNSQKIIDLRKSLSTSSQDHKTVSTQTNENTEAYKKFLYSQISQYLSSETKNLIYEELFIEKFAQKSNMRPTTIKRRKYR